MCTTLPPFPATLWLGRKPHQERTVLWHLTLDSHASLRNCRASTNASYSGHPVYSLYGHDPVIDIAGLEIHTPTRRSTRSHVTGSGVSADRAKPDVAHTADIHTGTVSLSASTNASCSEQALYSPRRHDLAIHIAELETGTPVPPGTLIQTPTGTLSLSLLYLHRVYYIIFIYTDI